MAPETIVSAWNSDDGAEIRYVITENDSPSYSLWREETDPAGRPYLAAVDPVRAFPAMIDRLAFLEKEGS